MLIWINGAFGAGKTHTAFELHRRAPSTHLADPELIGFGIHRMLPRTQRDDFQDLPHWRAAVLATLRQAEAAHDGPVLVPMTMVREDYFDEIIGGLRDSGVDVRHYALLASPETLRRRLRQRLVVILGNETWAEQQIDRCVAALQAERYATHIDTDQHTVNEVVEKIAEHAGIALSEPRLPAARYQLRRVAVGLRNIRL